MMLKYVLSGLLSLLFIFTVTAQDLTIKGIPQQQQATPQQELGAALDALSAPQPPLWNRSLAVEPGMESFDDGMHHAYSITIHELRKDNLISGEWKDRMKDRGSKVSFKKGVARAEGVNVPEIHYGKMTVLAKFDENKGVENVRLSVAFIHDGRAISPQDYPMEHEKAMQMMYNVSVELNRAVVSEQLAEQEDILKGLEKDLDNLRKDNERLHRTIEKNQRNLGKAQEDHQSLTNELAVAREQVQAMEGRLAYSPDPDQTKELVKMRKDIDKMESKTNKLESDQLDYQRDITDAQHAIPENEQAQQAKLREIELQKSVIERYRRKLADVR